MSRIGFPTGDERFGEIQARPVHAELITDPLRRNRLEQLKQVAQLLDSQFCIPGTNIEVGFDALIGLIPGVGDLISTAVSVWLIREARRLGAPWWLIARMSWNVAVDTTIGVIPVVGDMFDVVWKANRKNIELLSRHLERNAVSRG
ncbi:MAG: DUF4112 domain-containing protein [Planctomycetota bacterium]